MDRRGFLKFAALASATAAASSAVDAEAGTWIPAGTGVFQNTMRRPANYDRTKFGFSAGYNHTSAIRSDGLVFACGYYQGIGAGNAINQSTFVQSVGIVDAVSVASGTDFTMALRADGAVFGAGSNGYGQLGINSLTNTSSFTQSIGLSNIVSVSVGCHQYYAFAADANGNLFSTGYNLVGNLGNGNTSYRAAFGTVIGVSSVIAVACGGNHTLALTADGLLFAAGDNQYGQFGNGTATTTAQTTFSQSPGISNITAIAAGGFHSLALLADGTVFACGYTSRYYSFGTPASYSSFVQCAGLSNIVSIACGYYSSLALRDDGAIFGAGLNQFGQLASPTGTLTTFQMIVPPGQGVTSVNGDFHTAISNPHGNLLTVGQGVNGELGNGGLVNTSSFVMSIGV